MLDDDGGRRLLGEQTGHPVEEDLGVVKPCRRFDHPTSGQPGQIRQVVLRSGRVRAGQQQPAGGRLPDGLRRRFTQHLLHEAHHRLVGRGHDGAQFGRRQGHLARLPREYTILGDHRSVDRPGGGHR